MNKEINKDMRRNCMKAAVLSATIVLALLFIYAGTNKVYAETVEKKKQIPREKVVINSLPGENTRVMGFLAKESAVRRDRRSKLTKNERIVYDMLKRSIVEIAKGSRGDARVYISMNKLGLGGKKFPVKNGNELGKVMKKKIDINGDRLLGAILADFPYELYWFDKTKGTRISFPRLSYYWNSSKKCYYVWFKSNSELTFEFKVARSYSSANGINTAKTKNASGTRTAVDNIIRVNSGLNDIKKLEKYRDEIIERTDYDHAATAPNYVTDNGYGDPWQIIHIFDNNPNTKVVCEGYSKAFKFLCDLSSFKDPSIVCNTAVGNLITPNGYGPHMWNIVSIKGRNYLVDVTNMDNPYDNNRKILFLAGAPLNNGVYAFDCLGTRFIYEYDNRNMRRIFDDKEIRLSKRYYFKDAEIDENLKRYKLSGIKNFTVKNNKKYRGGVILKLKVGKLARRNFMDLSDSDFGKLKYGYKVEYRKKGSKKWGYKTFFSKKCAVSYTLKKLKKGKKYEVRARLFVTVKKVDYCGKWSKIKIFKVR